MEELVKLLGGLPGLFGLIIAAGALYWRIKVPQIGLEYLERELELHRKEIAEADKDRIALRDDVRAMKGRTQELEADYLRVLADREKCRQRIQRLERQLRALGQTPLPGEEER